MSRHLRGAGSEPGFSFFWAKLLGVLPDAVEEILRRNTTYVQSAVSLVGSIPWSTLSAAICCQP